MVAKPSDLSTIIWANGASGSDIANPDTATPGKNDLGWVAEFPPHQVMNYVQNRHALAIGHFNERGMPLWDSSTPYPIDAYTVLGGVMYRATSANTNSAPPNSNWVKFLESSGNSVTATTSVLGMAQFATQTQANNGDPNLILSPATLAGRTATTTRTGVAALATQTTVNTGTNNSQIVTSQTLRGNTATTSRRGVVELATQAEGNGSDSSRAVTASVLTGRAATESQNGLPFAATQTEVNNGSATGFKFVTPETMVNHPHFNVFQKSRKATTFTTSTGNTGFVNVPELDDAMSVVAGETYRITGMFHVYNLGGVQSTGGEFRFMVSSGGANAAITIISMLWEDQGDARVRQGVLTNPEIQIDNNESDGSSFIRIEGILAPTSSAPLGVQVRNVSAGGFLGFQVNSWLQLERLTNV